MALDESQMTQFEETGHLTVAPLLSRAQLDAVRERAIAIAGRVDFPMYPGCV